MGKLKEKYLSLSIPVKATIWFAFCGVLQKGIQFITIPLFTRLLSTSQYGEVSVYLSWFNIVSIFLTFNLYHGGFNNGMVQYEDKRDKFLSSMQGIVTIIALVVYLFYFLTRSFWNNLFEMDTLTVSVMFTEVLLHSALLFWSARVRYEYKYRPLVAYTIPVTVIPPVATIIAIKLVPSEFGSLAKIYVNAAFVVILCFPLYIRNIVKGKTFYNKRFWMFGLRFNIPLIPHYLSGILLNQADRIMIQKIVGNSQAGIYSLAYSASMVLNVATTAVNQSLSPWIYEKLKEKKYQDIDRVVISVFIGIAILIFMLVAFAPECIMIFGGNAYAEAIWIIPPVAASLYFIFVFQIFANLEFFYMKNKYITYASIVGAVLNIILNYYCIQWFGYIAAGYTTLVCYILFAICHSIFVRKIEKEYIGGIMVFDKRLALFIGAVLILLSQSLLLVYKKMTIRYAILLSMGMFFWYKRNMIKQIILKI